MTLTRYETLLIMPRTAGVSCNSLTELSRRRPRPRTVARCDSRVPIRLLTSCTLTVLSDMVSTFSPEFLRRTCHASQRCRPAWTACAGRRASHERGCTGSSNRGSWPPRSAHPSRRTQRASDRQQSRRYHPLQEREEPSTPRAYRALHVAESRSSAAP